MKQLVVALVALLLADTPPDAVTDFALMDARGNKHTSPALRGAAGDGPLPGQQSRNVMYLAGRSGCPWP